VFPQLAGRLVVWTSIALPERGTKTTRPLLKEVEENPWKGARFRLSTHRRLTLVEMIGWDNMSDTNNF
jgi:hypothetical protein